MAGRGRRRSHYAARSVIVATGTRLRDLGVPGESTLRGHGVSQCASCDAPLLRNQAVVVAGGGDSALQEALTLAAHCSSVTIVHHGDAYSGQAAYRAQVRATPRSRPCRRRRSRRFSATGPSPAFASRTPAAARSSERECAAAFVFVGLAPNTCVHRGCVAPRRGGLPRDRHDAADDGARHLAAGTVRAGCLGRAAAASGDGAAAALAADRFLTDGHWRG